MDNKMEEALTHDNKIVFRNLKRIEDTDFDSIIQNPDDIFPENRREREFFELRSELLRTLYETLNRLTKIEGDNAIEEKERIAKETVLRGVELRADIHEVLTPSATRKLRQDRRDENEYYEGVQGAIGMFGFERKPTPHVKLEEVIGSSFDRAKNHLMEIVETGVYSRIMTLSAPGRKVRSNILLIGPYGCGKTELARAICADKRVIGASVSVASTLTAYLHESVNNVKRIYDAAKKLYVEGREDKPVVLVLDEFDGWFARGESGSLVTTDMHQIENILLEVLDGMGDYNGIITMAMTNKPTLITGGILRRFRYVDVVGQLITQERADLLRMYLEKSLPVDSEVKESDYKIWAEKLEYAPGDVVRKVVDEIHFKLLPEYLKTMPREAKLVERVLDKREKRAGVLSDKDIAYVKNKLADYRSISALEISRAVDDLLLQPPIRKQIETAKVVYREAGEILEEISGAGTNPLGIKREKIFLILD